MSHIDTKTTQRQSCSAVWLGDSDSALAQHQPSIGPSFLNNALQKYNDFDVRSANGFVKRPLTTKGHRDRTAPKQLMYSPTLQPCPTTRQSDSDSDRQCIGIDYHTTTSPEPSGGAV